MSTFWITVGILLFIVLVIDAECYIRAKQPERSGHWWSHQPGGGFYALWKYGRNS